jgi:CheY-like chemotaxis protein
VDVNQAVADALEFTRVRWKDEAEERGVRFQVVTQFGAVPPVLGQAAEIREVLVNLILNALDAMPSGGALTITTKEEPATGESLPDSLLILISDTGTGIPEEARPHVFDPFFTTKGPQSSGLGLSVVFGIVVRHQGKIEIESEVGRGTTFRILFPVAREPKPSAPEPLPAGHHVSNAKCLVIDDDASVRAVLADALKSERHQVAAVPTAPEGLEALRQEAYDIVFTDLGMPGMTGWEIARAVRTIRPGTPVILVTGWGVQLSAEEGSRSGVRAVLSKPFEVGQLLDLLHEVLQSPEVPKSG